MEPARWKTDRRVFWSYALMTFAVMILGCVYLAGLLVLAGAVLRAPEGFEDDEGFHEGSHPATNDPAL